MRKLIKNIWIKRALLLTGVVAAFILMPHIADFFTGNGTTAFAIDDKTALLSSDAVKEKVTGITSVLVLIQKALNVILFPILALIGGLLDNSMIFGSGMEERLREIWVPVRNIVNIFFVIVLVGIALYNVLGLGDDNGSYSIKTMLPKIIVGIIVINFSFVGMKVFLDGINILTTAVFAIPTDISEDVKILLDEEMQSKLCDGADFSNEEGTTFENTICDEDGKFLNDQGKIFFQKYDMSNAAMALAIKMGNILFYEDVATSVTTLSDAFVSAVFSMLLYLAYAVSFFALLIVLLARVVVIWLAVALSPVVIVLLAVPELKEQLSSLGDVTTGFVKHAVAPLIAAFAMTVGWIMLDAFKSINSLNVVPGIEELNSVIPVAGLGSLQEIMAALATLAVIWVGVFAAAEGTIAKGITDTIKGGAEKLGGWLATAPIRFAPIIPIKTSDGEMITAGGMMEGLKRIPSAMKQKQSKEGEAFLQKVFPWLAGTPEDRAKRSISSARGSGNIADEINRNIPKISTSAGAHAAMHGNPELNKLTNEERKKVFAEAERKAGKSGYAAALEEIWQRGNTMPDSDPAWKTVGGGTKAKDPDETKKKKDDAVKNNNTKVDNFAAKANDDQKTTSDTNAGQIAAGATEAKDPDNPDLTYGEGQLIKALNALGTQVGGLDNGAQLTPDQMQKIMGVGDEADGKKTYDNAIAILKAEHKGDNDGKGIDDAAASKIISDAILGNVKPPSTEPDPSPKPAK